ncbi:alpha-amylase family glycosyl hydrolase [Haploplasma modicum]|uniref:alpha-amylase family glycosyl hydrolase n=1 Tax=Haploplasma modicum TaxID=2150 RepID=UPI000478E2B0|nr:alpha-amylase family glycosyl hydrolase [Haploplasma modicum]
MKAYVDNLNLIRVETNEPINKILLPKYKLKKISDNLYETDKEIELHLRDEIVINEVAIPLLLGNVTITNEFDQKYRYDGTLGYKYSKEETSFKIFSPVAKDIIIVIDELEYQMKYQQPIWHLTINEDLLDKKYYYKIKIEDTYEAVLDPYCFSIAEGECYIIDFSKTIKLDKTPIKIKEYADAVIYEGHVRDLTLNLDVKNKGLFKGLTEKSKILNSTILDYIKNLGITNLQLLPVFDFEDVDDLDKEKYYNWGYNPSNYFSVEGWYSKNPKYPYARINEFKSVISYAHSIKLGINMDVVYNHVFNHETYPYNKIVPNYFYRHDKDHKMTNSSYCGNDIETTRFMVRKLIVDSLIHFTKNYKIDGYRFDLMGLMDLETMREIELKLRKINPYIMLYGEGWNMDTTIKEVAANMSNQHMLDGYAHFNDFFRDTLKGDLHGNNKGYLNGNNKNIDKVFKLLVGSPNLFDSINKSVNYIECHDNLTAFDRMLLTKTKVDKIKDYLDFGNSIIAISMGIPFYHAGQESYRSKEGDENSYKSSEKLNAIKWNFKGQNITNFKEILKIRKKYLDHYKNPSDASITYNKKVLRYVVEHNGIILEHILINDYKRRKIKFDGKLIFKNKEVNIKKDSFIINKPGVYILLKSR